MTSRILYTPRSSGRAGSQNKRFTRAAALILIAGIAAGALYVLRAPYMQIRHMIVDGNNAVSTDHITAYIASSLAGNRGVILPKSSYWLVSNKDIAGALEKSFPRIESVEISKEFPDILRIKIQERFFWAVACGAGQEDEEVGGGRPCAYIDRTGFAYDSAPEPSGSLLLKIITDRDGIIPNNQILPQDISALLQVIENTGASSAESRIVSFEIRKRVPSEIRALTAEGFTLIFSRDADLANSFRVLKRILDEEIKDRRGEVDYIDLRIGNKVFYKLR